MLHTAWAPFLARAGGVGAQAEASPLHSSQRCGVQPSSAPNFSIKNSKTPFHMIGC